MLAVSLLAINLMSDGPDVAHAAAVASQCNGEQNGGGTQVACTVTVVNYVTAAGALSPSQPSTLTMTRCVGASGPLDTLTCTTTATTSAEPVTTIQQCNGSGSGGGGTVICTVTVTNHFVATPGAITDATIYMCVGSVITGTGAPGTCTPANTPGVTSVTAATVGQCNGSGNGGTSVGFVCTVTAGSTMTAALPVNVDQCNGSSNGGGALTTCQATVTNDVIAQAVPTPTPTAVPTATPTATPVPTATPAPTATPTATAVSGPVVPTPAETGNAGLSEDGGASPFPAGLLALATAVLVLTGRRIVSPVKAR